MRKITTILSTIIIIHACTQKAVYVKHSSKRDFITANSELLTYYLPKNVLHLRIPIIKVSEEEPLLLKQIIKEHKNSNKYLKDDTIIFDDLRKEYYQLVREKASSTEEIINEAKVAYGLDEKNIIVSTTSEPDMDKQFTVYFRNSPLYQIENNLKINAKGMISSGKVAQSNNAWEIAWEVAQFGVSVATKIGGFDYIVEAQKEEKPEVKAKLTAEDKLKIEEWAKRYVYWTGKDEQYLFIGIHESLDIVKYQQKKIDDNIIAVKATLFGAKKKKTHWIMYMCDPKKDLFSSHTIKEIDLLEIDSKIGIKVLQNDSSVAFIPEDLNGKKLSLILELPNNEYYRSLARSTSNYMNLDKTRKRSFFYNVPSKLNVSLKYGGNYVGFRQSIEVKQTTQSQQIYFAQLGVVKYLPANANKLEFEFFEDLGSIKSVNFSKDIILDKEKIGTGIGVADSIINIYKKLKYIESEALMEVAEEDEEVF